jgi:succinate-semialdehyde dehydrogenase/glutarate-semialdehyde dehydrogenase
MFPKEVLLQINGNWRLGSDRRTLPIINPATEETVGAVACASQADIVAAAEASLEGFRRWRNVSAFERSIVMRNAAALLRERVEMISRIMVIEQGKPVAQARAETLGAAEMTEWMAEESKRAYGRVIPPRRPEVEQAVVLEPVGPVAAFTPWNFPINQAVRKIATAIAAGCSIIVKGPEDTPGSCAELVRCFVDAGVPGSVVQLLYGTPAEISRVLIEHPVIRKVSFTGSTAVGKQLAALAGSNMKRVTMELGGHAPAIVCEDADVNLAVDILSQNKFRNAGQVCVSPTRFVVQESVFDQFVERFVKSAGSIKVGNGLEEGVTMGPLAHERRVNAMEALVADAVDKGADLVTGGKRMGNRGYFFEPTVLANVPLNARAMNEEPFGPIALINKFDELGAALAEANRLPYGLAFYAYTRSAAKASRISRNVEAGMVSINHHGIALVETPFGGIKDSGFGSEGGAEGLTNYMQPKFVTIDTRGMENAYGPI